MPDGKDVNLKGLVGQTAHDYTTQVSLKSIRKKQKHGNGAEEFFIFLTPPLTVHQFITELRPLPR